jgi:hypothetical protein
MDYRVQRIMVGWLIGRVGVFQHPEHQGAQASQKAHGRLLALLCCILCKAQELRVRSHGAAVAVEGGLRQCGQANQALL